MALTQQMLMWEDGVARTLDLTDDDLPTGSDERPPPSGAPVRATPMAARFAAAKPGDR